MSSSSARRRLLDQPLDRVAIPLIVGLAVIILTVMLLGSRVVPHVRYFSWQDRQVGANDIAFIMTFMRPMNRQSVEQNLKIEPPLQGRFSWAGRRMAYTLNAPAPYGQDYQVTLANAQDRFSDRAKGSRQSLTFKGQFQTRDRAFAYIGVEGEEAGRLILYNLTRTQKQILTPKELWVTDFQAFPRGDRLLFFALDRAASQKVLVDQQLYSVTTGISPRLPDDPNTPPPNWWETWLGSRVPESRAPGQIALVLDSKDYRNQRFELSADGRTIVVKRLDRRKPGSEFGLWLLRLDDQARPIDAPQPINNAGGEFLITPDGESLAVSEGQGLAIVPLQPQPKPLDFLARFARILDFSHDGALAAVVQFNRDYTRSLFIVNNQGKQEELFKISGSILNAQFDPTRRFLYCLLTEVIPDQIYREQPYLAVVDLQAKKLNPLLMLPEMRDIQLSLSPDGLALLFDQLVLAKKGQAEALRTSSGQPIASSRLWILPLAPTRSPDQPKLEPEEIPLKGFRPRWLP